MKRILPILTLLVMLLGFTTPVSAASVQDKTLDILRIERSTNKNGLPQNPGLTLLQGQGVFLWIGSEGGLTPHIGYQFITYGHELEIRDSLGDVPPFWQTWAFRISVTVFLIGIGVLALSLRNREIRAQRKKLEDEVIQRTLELQQVQQELSRRSEEKLSVSDARFRAMFENAGIGIALVGLDRRPIAVNDSLVRISGYSREELLGISGAVISHPEDLEIGKDELARLAAGKFNSYQVERRYQRKDNSVYWVRQTLSAVRNPEGQLIYLVVIVEDIDKQRKDQESLLESEARFKAMFENSAMGVFILDVQNLTVQANPAAQNIIEDVNFDRKLNDVFEFIDLKYRAAEYERIDRLLKGEIGSYDTERRYQRPGEEAKWAKLTLSAVRAQDGQVCYIVAMIEEITEQKKAQEELIESEARFRAIFENVSVGMSLMSLDRRAMAVNQAVIRITGFSEEELLKIQIQDLTYPEDREIGQTQFQEMVNGKRDSLQMEKRYLRKNGEVFWARVTYSLVRNLAGEPLYLVGSIEDINEQKIAAEKLATQEAEYLRTLELRVQERTHELSDANQKLIREIEHRQIAEKALASKAAEEAITAERTRLAHDLHDAVTQTLFSASLIAEVLPELWATNIKEAVDSTEELRQLTRGALAEMRTLLLELRPAALTQARLGDLLRQLCEALIGRGRLPIELKIEGDRPLPPDIQVALYRIAQESLNNVFKYARASKVDVNLSLMKKEVRLEVQDNGIGFDPGLVKPGSLGMRIMRERAAAINAQLKVSSSPGEGTLVSVVWKA